MFPDSEIRGRNGANEKSTPSAVQAGPVVAT
jgi:hypothetical protein